jgi:nucleotide-binding universal stress UspA family protein
MVNEHSSASSPATWSNAREGSEAMMYTRIVVPLDGSELAEVALRHANELSRMSGAPLHLVRIVDVMTGRPYGTYLAVEAAGYAEALKVEELESATYLATMKDRLERAGYIATTELRRGPASHEIIQLARTGDVIVMATHGRGGLRRWLLGSVAEEVVRHAPVPVLLIRADGIRSDQVENLTTIGAGVEFDLVDAAERN